MPPSEQSSSPPPAPAAPAPVACLTAAELSQILTDPAAAPSSSIPFAELLHPLVRHAAQSLTPLSIEHPWLSRALPGLESQLLARLSAVARLPLYFWFHLYRSGEPDPYIRFCDAMQSTAKDAPSHAPRWSGLFSEYPELARLMALISEQWTDSASEFLARLAHDSASLTPFPGSAYPRLRSVTAGLSDAHHHGRSVFRVNFTGDAALAYKPRSVAAELAFHRLLIDIASDDPLLRLPSAETIPSSGYGWMRWLSPGPAPAPDLWYARAGMLQCLLQTLGFADAHMANCVATADGPALIDCECLLTPLQTHPGQHQPGDPSQALAELESTSFLPPLDRPASEPDLSGLFGRGGQQVPHRLPVFSVTPQSCTVRFKTAVLRPQHNLLPATSPPIAPMAAAQAFVRGFQQMFCYLSKDPQSIRTALAAMEPLPSRVLLRGTRLYVRIMSQSIHPRLLRSPQQRRAFIRAELRKDAPAKPRILCTEIEAIESLNVPYFQAIGGDLYSAGQRLAIDFFPSAGIDLARRRLTRLSPARLPLYRQVLQLLWIRNAFSGASASPPLPGRLG